MRIQHKISRACKLAAVANYVRSVEGREVGVGILLLAPGQRVPAGYQLVLNISQN